MRLLRMWYCKRKLSVFSPSALIVVTFLFFAMASVSSAGIQVQTREDTNKLTELSLEELMNVEVVSASKTAEKISETSAAIFVITQDDIRRSGVTSIPEALRMVPGMEVARIDANKWAISARGFNDRFANKLLVLIDGRSVYSPFFSGVFWDAQDTMLEDIDRIEVIRGPGSALWGANAVNGVINIITKNAKETQGGLVTTGFGSEERGFGGVRYGGKIGPAGYYRIYGKYFDRDAYANSQDHNANDGWSSFRSGFRADFGSSRQSSMTLQGDVYSGSADQSIEISSPTPPYQDLVNAETVTSGGNIMASWKHSFSNTSQMKIQSYFDRTERKDILAREDRNTFDVDLQHSFSLNERQKCIWGLGYRVTGDDIRNSYTLGVDPSSRVDNLYSAFIQDEISLIPKILRQTVGLKFEHNDYTGFEVQPTVRLLWTPDTKNTIWAAISRAVRTPSRVESDGIGNNTIVSPGLQGSGDQLAVVKFIGNDTLSSEKLIAYELGYRVQPSRNLFFDLALFYNRYDEIIATTSGTPYAALLPGMPVLVFPYVAANNVSGQSHGLELAADWSVSDWWRLQFAYTYLVMQLDSGDDNPYWEYQAKTGTSPEHQVSLRSGMNLGHNLQLDLWLRYVDGLKRIEVDRYMTMDLRLSWKPEKNVEFAIVGQNLFNPNHYEFGEDISLPTKVQRGVYGKVTWQF